MQQNEKPGKIKKYGYFRNKVLRFSSEKTKNSKGIRWHKSSPIQREKSSLFDLLERNLEYGRK